MKDFPFERPNREPDFKINNGHLAFSFWVIECKSEHDVLLLYGCSGFDAGHDVSQMKIEDEKVFFRHTYMNDFKEQINWELYESLKERLEEYFSKISDILLEL